MSERQEVVEKRVGYSWSLSITRETRKPGSGQSKYDDKDVVEAKLTGNEESLDLAEMGLMAAKLAIRDMLEEEKEEVK